MSKHPTQSTVAAALCPRPFEWAEIHPDGGVFLCCPSWLKRTIGNLLAQPIDEIWNSPQALEIRKSILNRSYHNCSQKRCPRLLDPASKAVEAASSQAEKAISQGQVSLPYLPRRLNLCFDYSCNLACPSCRPHPQISNGTNLAQAEQLAERIRQQLLPTAEQLTLSGYGDPFASPVYFKLLTQITPHDAPQLKELRLHSNGLLFDENHWARLPSLQPLLKSVEISVDAGRAATYALNRGGDFARLCRNLEFVASLGAPLRLSMVVQQNNFREINDLHQIALGIGAELYLSRLINWGTFSRQAYKLRDVAAADHPQHAELLAILRAIKAEPGVDLGNLTQLLRS
ncbi:radical SAM/SPASM domain-containing protein [Geopsychrobacter electrodiphilus]|uniref:radical SAM/SPASM domain-containing protein n=1 Tax=Geopsychrobacter electrodiphilus TaxID=225196 RepID=UPI000380167B|nr:radical SAM/SPASM domain-containing protein [Geopsychrobacter electrodiphilus]